MSRAGFLVGFYSALCAGLLTIAGAAAALPPQACYAEGTPPEMFVIQSAAPAMGAPQAANVGSGWPSTATDGAGLNRGEPITLTWSVVPDDTPITGVLPDLNSGTCGEPRCPEASDPSSLGSLLNILYGTDLDSNGDPAWRIPIQEILDEWNAGPGVSFVWEPNDDMARLSSASGVLGVRGDIRIAGHFIDGDNMTVAYAFVPEEGGDIVIDVPDSFNTIKARFKNVLGHEVGHAIGLGHTCPVDRTKLMEPTISTFFSGPQQDDLLGAHRNYGDIEEENDAALEAADIGLALENTVIKSTLALDSSGDEDWFSIPAGFPSDVTVDIGPVGSRFNFAVAGTMGCSGVTTSFFDPTIVQNLSLEIVDFDGTTSIAFADATAAGGSEALVDVRVSRLGGFVRVAGGGVNDTQGYQIEVTLVPEPAVFSLRAAALLGIGMLVGWRRTRP